MTEKDYRRILKDRFIKYRATLNLPQNVTFGIEIEYENVLNELISNLLYEEELRDKNFSKWINKPEIDLFYEYFLDNDKVMNGEINSPILKDNIKTWKNLRTALNILNNNRAVVTNSCGGHVNIGSHILENNNIYWRNFLLLWILYEKEIYRFSSGEFIKVRTREENIIDRIKPLLNKNMSSILDMKYRNDICKYFSSIGIPLHDKTFDVSFVKVKNLNFKEDNRLEFRIPNGTLREEIWQNYINFFAKFMLACKKELDIDKIIYKINNNQHDVIEFADYLFDDNVDKEYFLIQTLKTNKVYKKELLPHIEHY